MIDSLPRLSHGFRFQWEPAQDCHVLLYPEGMVKLNRSAGEILARCDGETTVAAIVADIEHSFVLSGIEADVCTFLAMAAERNWVVLAAVSPAGAVDLDGTSGLPSVPARAA